MFKQNNRFLKFVSRLLFWVKFGNQRILLNE